MLLSIIVFSVFIKKKRQEYQMNQVLVLKMHFFLRFLLIGCNTCFEDFNEDLPTFRCCYALVKPHQRHVIIYFLSFFFIFCFIDCHLLSLFINLDVALSPNLSCVSPLIQTLETPLYGILKVTNTLSPNLSCVSLLSQTLEMSLLYGSINI